jgi:hypothetical protein
MKLRAIDPNQFVLPCKCIGPNLSDSPLVQSRSIHLS